MMTTVNYLDNERELLAWLQSHLVLSCLLIFVTYVVAVGVYRLFFHPLSRFPGPRIAALTLGYELYYDGIKKGSYIWEIKRMHEIYGPIVRISPDELHVSEPEFIDELYGGSTTVRNKSKYYVRQLDLPQSAFGTADHALHRIRRRPLDKYFSKASVSKLEPLILDLLDKLCEKMEIHYADTGTPLNLHMAYSCFTADVVTQYGFDYSYDLLDQPTFTPNFEKGLRALCEVGSFAKGVPGFVGFMKLIPESIMRRVYPNVAIYFKYLEDIKNLVDSAMQSNSKTQLQKDSSSQRTIFHGILQSDLPPKEKTELRLREEGHALVGAGTLTTAWTLSVIDYHLLDQPNLLARLQSELLPVMPDPNTRPAWSSLEQFPFLSAVILEGLRLSYGVSTRLQRISVNSPMKLKSSFEGKDVEWVIPPGAAVGMTSVLVHHDEELFPDSWSFNPDRWLDKEGKRDRSLERYLISFSKGSRQCLGINLAYAELYLSVAVVMRRLGDRMKLYETGKAEVEVAFDGFIPAQKSQNGVRVLLAKA